jgi:hypothetical protein
VAVNLKYGAEALALVGIAYGLIKWVGRTLRSLVSDTSLESSRLEALAASTPDAGADALVRQGIVSAEDLSGMSPREREFLVATAGPHLESSTGRSARRQTPRSMGVISGPGALPSARVGGSPRLHLITPSRPPLGVAVHCPGCGVLLDREALQRFGATTCSRCKRPVSAHIQRGRLTVTIEETAEEAEHRRRLDGDPRER